MKKPEINQNELEEDVNKLLSFLNDIDNLDIENTDLNKLVKELKKMQKDLDIEE